MAFIKTFNATAHFYIPTEINRPDGSISTATITSSICSLLIHPILCHSIAIMKPVRSEWLTKDSARTNIILIWYAMKSLFR